MVYTFDGFNHLICLNKGEHLQESLQKFAAKTNLDGAWLTGIGGAQEVTLGFYNLTTKQYQWKTFNGLREVTSLQGNLALYDGKPMFHLHGTFADDQYQTIGGHVKDLVVGATLEVFVHRNYQPIQRSMNADIGLPLLNVKNNAQ